MDRSVGILAVAIAFTATIAPWTSAATAQENPMQFLSMKGTCNKLVIGLSDYGQKCQGQLMNSAYKSGRVGFWFLLSDGGVFTFSGLDGENPTEDSDVILLDKMIVNLGGGADHTKTVPVSGKCIHTNPYLGEPAMVSCSGTFKKGQRFSAIFVSDGSPPA